MTNQTHIKPEFILLCSAASLLLIGLLNTLGTSIYFADIQYDTSFKYLVKHVVSILLGIIAGFIAFKIPLSIWHRHSRSLLMMSLTLLFLVLYIGKVINGYTRWIPLGRFDFLPSEFVKLFLISYLAAYIQKFSTNSAPAWKGFFKPLCVLLLAGFLLMLQPDIDAFIVIFVVMVSMAVLSCIKQGRYPIISICFIIALVLIFVNWHDLSMNILADNKDQWSAQFAQAYSLRIDYVSKEDLTWFGAGLGNSTNSRPFINDITRAFDLSVFAEEMGLVAIILMTFIYSNLLHISLKIALIAEKNKQLFETYFAYGIFFMFAVQGLMSLFANLRILAAHTSTLPFVGADSTTLIVNCICIGVLIKIYKTVGKGTNIEKNSVHKRIFDNGN